MPLVFDNYSSSFEVDEQTLSVCLWDTAGQEDYDRLRPMSYPDTDLFIIVFSLTDRNSFYAIRDKWYPEISHYSQDTPVIIIGINLACREDHEWCSKNIRWHEGAITNREGTILKRELNCLDYFETELGDIGNVVNVFTDCLRSYLTLNIPKKQGRSRSRSISLLSLTRSRSIKPELKMNLFAESITRTLSRQSTILNLRELNICKLSSELVNQVISIPSVTTVDIRDNPINKISRKNATKIISEGIKILADEKHTNIINELYKSIPRRRVDSKIVVQINRANSIFGADRNGLSNSYCCVYLNDSTDKRKTSIRYKTVSPVFHETIIVPFLLRDFTEGRVYELWVTLWHENTGKDKFLGQVSIPLYNIRSRMPEQYYLLPRPGKNDDVSGSLKISVYFQGPAEIHFFWNDAMTDPELAKETFRQYERELAKAQSSVGKLSRLFNILRSTLSMETEIGLIGVVKNHLIDEGDVELIDAFLKFYDRIGCILEKKELQSDEQIQNWKVIHNTLLYVLPIDEFRSIRGMYQYSWNHVMLVILRHIN
eukprot:TRINITY_DN1999_c0_g1_i3.p1 TRINITY_DN1999_c0_g1~~TRINITY_DN1999_c0_g1_i3.p1  ORF type:complete len:600 (-),score=93.00 TRINITY_DN1999_c0_g1_i3:1339-2964(-)